MIQKQETVAIGWCDNGNTVDFGDLTIARRYIASTSNNIRGVWGGGTHTSDSTREVTIDYVTIASTGNALDFGDLTSPGRYPAAACSSAHGGI